MALQYDRGQLFLEELGGRVIRKLFVEKSFDSNCPLLAHWLLLDLEGCLRQTP